ncbi:MAG: hypothetical protein RL344_1453 [Pseudomonadota bacterium]|jgi:hypothetical protein
MLTITPLHQCQCFNTSCYHCFVNGLKRDKARGQLAPHQLILLLALLTYIHTHHDDNDKQLAKYATILNMRQLNDYFQIIWKQHRHRFTSTNSKIGLPLQAFFNQHLVQLKFNSNIDDIRRTEELILKLDHIMLLPKILNIFLNHTHTTLYNYFEARVDC